MTNTSVYDLPGIVEVEISNDRIIGLKGRCKAGDFKNHIVGVDDYVCDC